MAGLDAASIRRALDEAAEREGTTLPDDPVVAAIASLRSGDLSRMRQVLRVPARRPADRRRANSVAGEQGDSQSSRQGADGAGCARCWTAGRCAPRPRDAGHRSPPAAPCPEVLRVELARDGLVQALAASSLEVRLRCGRALLALTDKHPELALSPPSILAVVERELTGPADDADEGAVREHIFNLLALVLEREPVQHRGAGLRLRRRVPAWHRARVSRDRPSTTPLRGAGSATLGGVGAGSRQARRRGRACGTPGSGGHDPHESQAGPPGVERMPNLDPES